MYAQIRLLKGFKSPLLYAIPAIWHGKLSIGDIVTVPIQRRKELGVLLSFVPKLTTNPSFAIRSILQREPFPHDPVWQNFTQKVAAYYFLDNFYFYTRIRSFITSKPTVNKKPLYLNSTISDNASVTLTSDQERIVSFLLPKIVLPEFTPVLIHGVTGSGKTEVYKKVITTAIRDGKSVIFMTPEVSLATVFEELLRASLPSDIDIIGFHSLTPTSQRRRLWQQLIKQKPMVIVGVHLPVLLPIPNLGLIVVDEEHESGYREKKHPCLQSKELALWRAQTAKIPIVLGSATPSVTSLAAVDQKKWSLFSLPKRFAGRFPQIIKAPLITKKKRASFWITDELEAAISSTLLKKEQVILYINRRGYAFFVICNQCGKTITCTSCSVTLTLHQQNSQTQLLTCHYCGYTRPKPDHCLYCQAPGRHLGCRGIGTQQLINIVQKMFPQARIARADLDSVKQKRAWQETVLDFSKGNVDILVGTQTITKGYHFPNVTLVGVIWSDLHLNIPLYTAREQTLQKLIQVAGRAGRTKNNSAVILQIMEDNQLFDYVDEMKYRQFFENEMAVRKLLNYPPFCRLVLIEVRGKKQVQVHHEAQTLAELIQSYIAKNKLHIVCLGPIKPAIHRIKNLESQHIYIKANNYNLIYQLVCSIKKVDFKSEVLISPSL